MGIGVLRVESLIFKENAMIEATEEAILNSLFKAATITGNGHTVEALPIDKVREIMKKYGKLK